jgi:16S rRNA (guanine527-N7)-methyltransferase
VKHGRDADVLRAQAALLDADLDDSQLAMLLDYERLLEERAGPLGLVAEGDVEKLRDRHVLDSLRAAAPLAGVRDAYDLGSGAGLPGIVVAIARPDVRVGLVDSRRRRVAFLELAVAELRLTNASVLGLRVETLTEPVDACLARAFAPAARAWEVAEPLLRPGGRLVYFAGRSERTRDLGARPPLVNVLSTPVLESAGPLVIMTRQ